MGGKVWAESEGTVFGFEFRKTVVSDSTLIVDIQK
ncbi:MAG: hypothetical protein ACI94Y_003808 [Maribacter sp.]|jgi:hypothetical protein